MVSTGEAQMQVETAGHPSDAGPIDAGLNRLPRDFLGIPTEVGETDVIDYASLEFEVERMGKRLAVWKIFMGYLGDGARTWSEVQQALTHEDLEKIASTCDGVPLRDLLLDLR
jgi:hypothetical protein